MLKEIWHFYGPVMFQKFPIISMAHQFIRYFTIGLGKHKQQVVHAASVGTKDGAVLIVGKGGSGKSTSALACLNAGMYYLGDDYTLISNDSNPQVLQPLLFRKSKCRGYRSLSSTSGAGQ